MPPGHPLRAGSPAADGGVNPANGSAMAGLYEVVAGHTEPLVAEHDPPWRIRVLVAWNDDELVSRKAVHVGFACSPTCTPP